MSEHLLTLVAPGLHTLVVDHGRPCTRSLGVPVGGAADRWSLAIGNGLVGNAPETAALEIALAGPILKGDCDLACVVYGAPFTLATDHQSLISGRTFTLRAGEELRIGSTHERVRGYFCVTGGLLCPEKLGSRSSLAPLAAGTRLPCLPGSIRQRSLGEQFNWDAQPDLLRVLDGAQADWFHTGEFFDQEFSVTPASNRMGLRLQGVPLTLPDRELVSEPVCPGTVQVTRDGQCIVLGVDGQTIGGYPKIAQVINADLDKLAQLRPGTAIHFQRVSLVEAERLYDAKQAERHVWLTRLRTTEAVV